MHKDNFIFRDTKFSIMQCCQGEPPFSLISNAIWGSL
jgi:hypothetical protein